jgi:hypothetical protein
MNPKSKFTRPKTETRKKLYYFMQRNTFKWIQFALIFLSIFPFFMKVHRATDSYDTALRVLIWVTFVIYIIELIFKISVIGFQIFKKATHVFEVVLILIEIVIYFIYLKLLFFLSKI